MTASAKDNLRSYLASAMELFNSSSDGLTDLEHATAIQIGRLLWAYQHEERMKAREDAE